MVQFNELRIGNLVHVGNGIYERVLEILLDSITTETKQGIFDFEGIPLTPEKLEKAGFNIKNGYGYKHKKLKCILTKVADADGFHVRMTDLTLEYQYFHQLQNLYFALTGEELQIEL